MVVRTWLCSLYLFLFPLGAAGVRPCAALPLAFEASASLQKITTAATAPAVPFTQNVGQYPQQVLFGRRTFRGLVTIEGDGIRYALNPDTSIQESFIGGHVTTHGVYPSRVAMSFYRGAASHWKQRVPSFDGVMLARVWDGIDVEISARGSNIEKLFHVAPGASPRLIRMRFESGTDVSIDPKTADLIVRRGAEELRFTRPVALQRDREGRQVSVPAAYRILSPTSYGFDVGPYDPHAPLLIDPLIAGTYVGGAGIDGATAVSTTVSGDIVICGQTDGGPSIPAIPPYENSSNYEYDVFVARLSSDLSTLVSFTLLGGTGVDECHALLESSSNGDIVVAGRAAMGFPTVSGAYDESLSGSSDGFIAILSPLLDTLVASSYLGGTGDERIRALSSTRGAMSGEEQWVVGGESTSADYPFAASPLEGVSDQHTRGIVATMSRDLHVLEAATNVGQGADVHVRALTVDPDGQVYVTGEVNGGFGSMGGLDRSEYGARDCFVACFNAALSSTLSSLVIGGSSDDRCSSIAWRADAVYVAGETESANLPVTPGALDTTFGGLVDGFVARVSSGLGALDAMTYLGGSSVDRLNSVVSISAGEVVVAGTGSRGYPQIGAPEVDFDLGTTDIVVSKLSSDLASLSYSRLFGGSGDDEASAVTSDMTGAIIIAGQAGSDFPITANSYQPSLPGIKNAVVAKVSLTSLATEQVAPQASRAFAIAPIVAGINTPEITPTPEVGVTPTQLPTQTPTITPTPTVVTETTNPGVSDPSPPLLVTEIPEPEPTGAPEQGPSLTAIPTSAPLVPTAAPTQVSTAGCRKADGSDCVCRSDEIPTFDPQGSFRCVARMSGVFPGQTGELLPRLIVEQIAPRGNLFDATMSVDASVLRPILRPQDVARARRILRQRFKMNDRQIQRELRRVKAVLEVRIEPASSMVLPQVHTPLGSKSAVKAEPVRGERAGVQRLRSRMNRVTARGLSAGAYLVTYRVEIVLPSLSLGFSGVSTATRIAVQ